MNRATRIAHLTAVGVMAIAVLIATADGFAQSWVGLYQWALAHGLTGWRAKSFPAMVDVFILVGELGLFALALEGFKLTKTGLAWFDLAVPAGIAAAGWGVSLAFNVGHVDHRLSDQLTAAVPPIASMLGLLVLLRTLHRLVGQITDGAEPTPARVPEDAAGEANGEHPDGADFGWPQTDPAEASDAGHPFVRDLPSAVISARAAGLSGDKIAKAFTISKYRVWKILEEAEDDDESDASDSAPEPHTMNGHAPTGATDTEGA